MAKKAVRKKAVLKQEAPPEVVEEEEPKGTDLGAVPLEDLLEEVKRRNFTFLIIPADTPVTIRVGDAGADDEPGEEPPADDEAAEPPGIPELIEDDPAEEVEIAVGDAVTFEDEAEGPLAGTVTKIDGEEATVEVEGAEETYEYELPLTDLALADNSDDEDAEEDPESWDGYSVDNLGLRKQLAAKLAKLKIEDIGTLQQALAKGTLKGKLSAAEVAEINQGLKDLK